MCMWPTGSRSCCGRRRPSLSKRHVQLWTQRWRETSRRWRLRYTVWRWTHCTQYESRVLDQWKAWAVVQLFAYECAYRYVHRGSKNKALLHWTLFILPVDEFAFLFLSPLCVPFVITTMPEDQGREESSRSYRIHPVNVKLVLTSLSQ